MERQEFITIACAVSLRTQAGEATRRDHVAQTKATAEAMADALGLRGGGPTRDDALDDLARAHERIRELEGLVEARDEALRVSNAAGEILATERNTFRNRVAELEADLEKATAPPPAAPAPTKGRGR